MGIPDRVVLAATEQLKQIGFKKRAGEIYTYEPTKDFLGWLGLNTARRGRAFEVNPVVGIRNQELEKRLADLLCTKVHSYIPPTISISLGYLMPEKHYQAWLFEKERDLAGIAGLVDAVATYAVPFINSSASIGQIKQLLESNKYGHKEHIMYRLPLVRLMLDDRNGALELCRRYLTDLNDRVDLAAESYRRF